MCKPNSNSKSAEPGYCNSSGRYNKYRYLYLNTEHTTISTKVMYFPFLSKPPQTPECTSFGFDTSPQQLPEEHSRHSMTKNKGRMTKCLPLPQQLALTNFQLLNKLVQVWSVCGELGGTQINENSSFLQLPIRQRSVCAGCHRDRHNRHRGASSEFRCSSHLPPITALLSTSQDI